MKPKITPESEAAKNRIAEVRQQVNLGATPTEARATVNKGPQPVVSANELVNPPAKVNPPLPIVNTNTGANTSNLVSNVVDNTTGFITAQSEEAAKAKELANLLGTEKFDGAGQRASLSESYGLPANLSRLTDIQTQLTKANTGSDLQKVQIESGGQGAIQGQRTLTQQDREHAVRTAGLAAEAAVLQGSIETASTLINSAMTDYYNDRQLKNANMIQQLNYFSDITDKQTSQLLQKEQRKYEEDQALIKEVKDSVNTAMVSGVASTDEITKLTDPSVTDSERLTIAQNVIARRAKQEYNLDKAIKGRQYEKLGLEIDSENAKILAAQKAAESGTLTPTQFAAATELRKEVNNLAEVKAAKDLEPNVAALISALGQETGVGDIAAINAFQRIAVDPGVAVREGDVALLQSAQSFTDQAALKAKGLWVGEKLTPKARQEMLDVANGVYKFRVTAVDENTQPVRTMAQEQGIDYGKYIGKNFASFEEIQNKVKPQDSATWGMSQDANVYLDDVFSALSQDPTANPFGVNLGSN